MKNWIISHPFLSLIFAAGIIGLIALIVKSMRSCTVEFEQPSGNTGVIDPADNPTNPAGRFVNPIQTQAVNQNNNSSSGRIKYETTEVSARAGGLGGYGGVGQNARAGGLGGYGGVGQSARVNNVKG
mgnify:CR=1 FL=1